MKRRARMDPIALPVDAVVDSPPPPPPNPMVRNTLVGTISDVELRNVDHALSDPVIARVTITLQAPYPALLAQLVEHSEEPRRCYLSWNGERLG